MALLTLFWHLVVKFSPYSGAKFASLDTFGLYLGDGKDLNRGDSVFRYKA